ncbi:hypothetical protein [Serratia sp. Tan611]|uniref:hypothetical protein n=1 Tax=Serratia sp. Tan611 TaxID=2773264 RepID=UPI001933E5E9|nr:hypothetical protein [Serratia sp. Tan611]CAE1141655.1 conserved protein of unknown function [Serratia sp. Tan611]
MSTKNTLPALDADRLLENALTSIRLGVEDFNKSQRSLDAGGDPDRALSAVRNLFSGVLLLFKYKIAKSVDESSDAASLIFNPPEVLPVPDGSGGVKWEPSGKFKKSTIDVGTIKKRFEGFGIDVDWRVINKLQDCRNHLEHLHPANTLGEVADFVAELFPVLRDFIQQQLDEHPGDLLGESWQIMLAHHNFFVDTRKENDKKWLTAGVPEQMLSLTTIAKCEVCGSLLIAPNTDQLDGGETVKFNEESLLYHCLACNNYGLAAQLLIDTLNEDNFVDPRNGGEPIIETCYSCHHETFDTIKQRCLWCDEELDHKDCVNCGVTLSQDEQGLDGRCGYCNNQYDKYMRD